VLPNLTEAEAVSTAERIRSAVEADNPGGTLQVTLTIGVVSSESAKKKAEVLIADADKAMYDAKRTKNCVAIG
jgi:diguanylate cyclase (GGDEF)-like protein